MISAGMAPNASAIPIPLQIADDFALTVLVHLPGLALDCGVGATGMSPPEGGVGKTHPRPFSFIVGCPLQRASSARRLRRDHIWRTPRVVLMLGIHPISGPHAVIAFGTNQATP